MMTPLIWVPPSLPILPHRVEYGTRIKKINVLRAYYTYGYGRTTLVCTVYCMCTCVYCILYVYLCVLCIVCVLVCTVYCMCTRVYCVLRLCVLYIVCVLVCTVYCMCTCVYCVLYVYSCVLYIVCVLVCTAYYAHGTGVLRLRLRAYRGYNYGRATGVLWACGRV